MSDLKNVQPLADFNWDEFENGGSSASNKQELEQAYNETLNKVSEHQVIEGTVISADKKEVIVNIGYKSDGIIPASEFRYNPDLKVGDKVEVYVENQEDRKGQLVLSHKRARLSKSWERVNAALDNEEVIQGYIKCRTKGGMIVDVFGIEAFLPGSQIDVHPIRDYDVFVGKTMEFKVVKINQEFRNVVVSHKALIEAELEAQKKEIISKLEKGQKVVVVEDLISTGGSVIDVVDALREAGAEVLGIVSIFTYGMQKGLDRLAAAEVKNISLTNLDVLSEVAADEGYIKPEDVSRLIAFRNNPSDESWIGGAK